MPFINSILRFAPTILFVLVTFSASIFDLWKYYFVPTLHPSFADLRSITSTVDCSLTSSPWSNESTSCDPWGRSFNYPRIWLFLFKHLGIGYDLTQAAGFVFLGLLSFSLFYWNAIIIRSGKSIFAVSFLILIYLSPPILLLAERGNTDIIIFLLLTLIVVSDRTGGSLKTMLLISITTFLKLFTIGSIVIYFYAFRRKLSAIWLVPIILLPLVTQWQDLIYIRQNTAYTYWTSFGIAVIPLWLEELFEFSMPLYLLLSIGLALFLFLFIYFNSFFNSFPVLIKALFVQGDTKLLQNRMTTTQSIFFGASLTAYFLGTSYDYRLVFLIPLLSLISLEEKRSKINIAFLTIFTGVMFTSRFGIFAVVGDFLMMFLCFLFIKKIMLSARNSE